MAALTHIGCFFLTAGIFYEPVNLEWPMIEALAKMHHCGSTSSPRTEISSKIKVYPVRPELVEGFPRSFTKSLD
jgi:hypothetical protein